MTNALVHLHDEAPESRIWYDTDTTWNAYANCSRHVLHESAKEISLGLAQRLAHYARIRLEEIGFGGIILEAEVHVRCHKQYGSSKRPEDMTYVVGFRNDEGGEMGIEGIFISNGWPVVDHGYFLDAA
jgi:hypothetical protein